MTGQRTWFRAQVDVPIFPLTKQQRRLMALQLLQKPEVERIVCGDEKAEIAALRAISTKIIDESISDESFRKMCYNFMVIQAIEEITPPL